MVTAKTTTPPPTKTEVAKILADTAHAVKVMKASWLHVALNLKKIRQHQLWEYTNPPCESYEEYIFEVLKLNKYVANRMLRAMEYTEEHRPEIIEDFRKHGDTAEVPSYEVVNQLRRVETSFKDRVDDVDELRSRVFDDGVGRVVLKREIDARLGKMDAGSNKTVREMAPEPTDSIQRIIEDLMAIENRLLELKVSKEAQKLAFQLVEILQREK